MLSAVLIACAMLRKYHPIMFITMYPSFIDDSRPLNGDSSPSISCSAIHMVEPPNKRMIDVPHLWDRLTVERPDPFITCVEVSGEEGSVWVGQRRMKICGATCVMV
jgi:hypothetical protein